MTYGQGNFKKGFTPRQGPEPTEFRLYKPYVGTGNQSPPDSVKERIKVIAAELEKYGYILRTGGMDGTEDTFEKAAHYKELHLPWRGFASKESKMTFNSGSSLGIAKLYHSNFDNMKQTVQAFLSKNVRLLYGNSLKSPALFLLCWTEDGAETMREKTNRTGPAGHAIAIALSMRIPVFNLGKEDAEDRLRQYLDFENQGPCRGPVVKREKPNGQEKVPELNNF